MPSYRIANRIAVVIGSGTLALACAGGRPGDDPPAPVPAPATTPAYAFSPTSFEGGGFQNVVAVSTTDAVLSGADISGIERTVNVGTGASQFHAQNLGFCLGSGAATTCGDWTQQIATVVYDPSGSAVYAGTGENGSDGGIFRSTDDGKTWTPLCTGLPCPMFSGNHTATPGDAGSAYVLPLDHPRMTGNLIAVVPNTSILLAAPTWDAHDKRGGLMRSVDGGADWTVLGLESDGEGSSGSGEYHWFRGVAYDANSDTLYVADYGNGVWAVGSASSCAPCTPVSTTAATGLPLSYVEELAWVNGTLYAAAGYAGVYQYTAAGGWSPLNLNLPGVCDQPTSPAQPCTSTSVGGATGSIYMSIAGAVENGKVALFVGGLPSPRAPAAVYLLAPDTTSWVPLMGSDGTASTDFNLDVMGGSDDSWWMGNATSGVTDYLPNGNGFVASFIAIDPNHNNRVYVAGRSGVWASLDCGFTNSFNCTFAPLVHDMNVTGVHGFSLDTRLIEGSYHAVIGDHDFGFMWSTDEFTTSIGRLQTGIIQVGANQVHTEVYDTSLDPYDSSGRPLPVTSPSAVLAAVGDIDNTGFGDIYECDDPTSPAAMWSPYNLEDTAGEAGAAIMQVAVGHPAGAGSGSPRVVIAAEYGQGMWWCSAPNACAQAAGSAYEHVGTNPNGGQLLWPDPLTPTVYFYDPVVGLFQSVTAGASWTLVWSGTSNNEHHTGWIAADATGANVFASIWGDDTHAGGIWRLAFDSAGALTGTYQLAGPAQANLTTPGAIAYDAAGRLWATDFDPDSGLPALGYWTGASTATGALGSAATPWTSVDDSVYRGASLQVTGLVVGPDGKVFVEEAHNGLLRGDPQ